MAGAFKVSLTLPSSISPFLFKPTPFPSPVTTILFPKSPFIAPPITITRANNQRTESNTAIVVDSDVEDDDEYYDDEDDEDDEEFMAFEDMRKWELSKPVGFGEGKVYDTTVEGKLLEEMERGRDAQIAAEKKKKKQELPLHPQPQSQKDFVTSGPCVRLENLPKKKNIHRDLQAAFKGFKGIVSISPANIGNRKTRDPICKGFAFVEFISKEAALRFVDTFSQQEIRFGKLQKKISFDVINSEQLVTSTQTLVQLKFANVGAEKQEELIGVSIADKTIEGHVEPMTGATAPLSDSKKIDMIGGHTKIPLLKGHENDCNVNELSSDNLKLPFQDQNKQIASKKKVVKKKPAKTAKPSLPSSMTRLQVKERGVLAGVFTKYGGKVASLSD